MLGAIQSKGLLQTTKRAVPVSLNVLEIKDPGKIVTMLVVKGRMKDLRDSIENEHVRRIIYSPYTPSPVISLDIYQT